MTATMTKREESLIDGIKHANGMLLELWEKLGETGPTAELARSIHAHLCGTITSEAGQAYITQLDTAETEIARLRASLNEGLVVIPDSPPIEANDPVLIGLDDEIVKTEERLTRLRQGRQIMVSSNPHKAVQPSTPPSPQGGDVSALPPKKIIRRVTPQQVQAADTADAAAAAVSVPDQPPTELPVQPAATTAQESQAGADAETPVASEKKTKKQVKTKTRAFVPSGQQLGMQEILKKEGKPLNTAVLAEKLIQGGYYKGELDAARLCNSIFSLLRRDRAGLFTKAGKGTWGLREWAAGANGAEVNGHAEATSPPSSPAESDEPAPAFSGDGGS